MTTLPDALLAGRWQLGDRIGRGAVADVHAAVDTASGGEVAVKVLRHADPAQRARFAREVSALESLDHPGIVRVLGHGEVDDRPFLVLDRVDGGSLADRLTARGPLPAGEAAELGAALAAALDHAHSRGVVHRDVKPSNVLCEEQGRPRLADFGVAQLDGSSSLTASGFTVGTAAYLAPEQVRGEAVGPAADVYALGLLLLEAVTGERAYPGTGVAAAMARLEQPPEVPPSVPGPLAARVRAMTAMAPGDRPAADVVARDLATIAWEVADGGTEVLPVVDDPTEVVAVVPAVPAVEAEVPVPRRWSPALVAATCFVLGFLLVAGYRELTGTDGFPAVPVSTTSTAVPPTTAAPTTAAPATAPPADDDRDDDEHPGRGRGRRDD